MQTVSNIRGVLLGTALSIGIASLGSPALGQVNPEARALGSLAGIDPPLPDVSPYVDNQNWLRVLGKALAWDQQVGSDGRACANCHFHAGADIRRTNILAPGLPDRRFPSGDTAFGSLARRSGSTRTIRWSRRRSTTSARNGPA